jgi:NAD(P)-dependent dehydrogenase (short-subunit alcohol dehydrogenase family)
MTDFADKRVLITGASSGIGLATARALLAGGARVLAVDLAEPPADLVPTASLSGDVGDPAIWPRVAGAVRAQLGGLDWAFLNAGVATRARDSDITAVEDAEYRRVSGVNSDGVFYGARTAVAEISASGGPGAIVATSSLAGLIAFAPDPVYTMTKHAVIGLVRALAEPLRPRGITINAVCPGLTDTPILTDEMRESIASAGFPLIDVGVIVGAVLDRFTGTETGGAWVCQPGREPTLYKYRGVPGPVGHELPPQDLSGI